MENKINKRIEKNKSFGIKVIQYSYWEILLLIIIIFISRFFIHFQLSIIMFYFILGIISSPLLIQQYKTGKSVYAGIYGGMIGLGFGIIFIATDLPRMSAFRSLFHALYGVVWFFLGISVIFTILRKRLIQYIKNNK